MLRNVLIQIKTNFRLTYTCSVNMRRSVTNHFAKQLNITGVFSSFWIHIYNIIVIVYTFNSILFNIFSEPKQNIVIWTKFVYIIGMNDILVLDPVVSFSLLYNWLWTTGSSQIDPFLSFFHNLCFFRTKFFNQYILFKMISWWSTTNTLALLKLFKSWVVKSPYFWCLLSAYIDTMGSFYRETTIYN